MMVSSSRSSSVTARSAGASNTGAGSMLLLGRYQQVLDDVQGVMFVGAHREPRPTCCCGCRRRQRSSNSTSSPVTVLMTSGPVMNVCEVLTMTVKSVMAGEYTAPPAQGPMINEIWGSPGGVHIALEDLPVQPGETTPSWMRAPPIVDPDHRTPVAMPCP